MNKLKLMLLAAVVLLSSGCAKLRTETTPFYNESLVLSGNIYVISKGKGVDQSQEFQFYKKKLEESLRNIGYNVVDNEEDADYKALLSYGIGKGTKVIYYAKFNKNHYTMSGKKARSHIMALSLEIIKDDKVIYEVRTRSQGQCGVLSGIYDDLLDALLDGFPGNSGDLVNDTFYRFKGCYHL
ncbi:MAG: hypothetical protein GY793_00380 [Proteobacteria bacterium]|nr:hypothetical protein [Pseudomonadota bacterium]